MPENSLGDRLRTLAESAQRTAQQHESQGDREAAAYEAGRRSAYDFAAELVETPAARFTNEEIGAEMARIEASKS